MELSVLDRECQKVQKVRSRAEYNQAFNKKMELFETNRRQVQKNSKTIMTQ